MEHQQEAGSAPVPPALAQKLRELEAELADGDITQQGFEKKRQKLLAGYAPPPVSSGLQVAPSAPPRGQSWQSVAEPIPPVQSLHLTGSAPRRLDDGPPPRALTPDDPRAIQNRGSSPPYQPQRFESGPPPMTFAPDDPRAAQPSRPYPQGPYPPHVYSQAIPGHAPGYGPQVPYGHAPGYGPPLPHGYPPGYGHPPPHLGNQPSRQPQYAGAGEPQHLAGSPMQNQQPHQQPHQQQYWPEHQEYDQPVASRRSSVSGSGVINPSITSSPSMTPHSVSREGSVADYRLEDSVAFSPEGDSFALHSVDSPSTGQNSGWRGTLRFPAAQPNMAPSPQFLDPQLSKKYAHVPALLGKQALPTRRRLSVPPQIDKATGANLASFPAIASLLRFRAQKTPKQIAFTVTDHKGRDLASISFEKLNGRAEKISQTIKEKTSLKRGDSVALIYKRSEALESVVALYGCLFAGMIAVPIATSSVHADDELTEILFILDNCKIGLALTTEAQLKTLTREFRAQRNTSLPRTTEFLETTHLSAGTGKRRGPDTPVTVNSAEVAYIEHTKNASGELKGVGLDNRVILSQCLQLRAGLELESVDVIVSGIENRVQAGLLATSFLGVFAGCNVVWIAEAALTTPGAWMGAITRHKATVALMDNISLMDVVGVASSTASSKKLPPPDLGTLRTVLVNTPLGSPQFLNDVEKLLGEHGLPAGALAPFFTLDEFGGTALALGALGARRVEIWIDAAAFKNDRIRILAYTTPNGQRVGEPPENAIRLCDAGCILPDASVAIVDPLTESLRPPNFLGEIWCNAQELLPRSFVNLAPLSEQMFRNHPLLYVKENPSAVASDAALPSLGFRVEVIDCADFIRSGFRGFIVDGNFVPGVTIPRLFVAGLSRDRILQRRLLAGAPEKPLGEHGEYEAHFTTDLIATLCEKVAGVRCCAIFSTQKLGENLPIVVIESTRPPNEFRGTATSVASILLSVHGLRAYAVVAALPGVLPRSQPRTGGGTLLQTTFHGYSSGIVKICSDSDSTNAMAQPRPLPRGSSTKSTAAVPAPEIGTRKLELIDVELCRKAFLSGELPIAHLWMNVESDVMSTLAGGENAPIDAAEENERHANVGQVVGGMSQNPLRDDRTGADLESFPTMSHLLAYRGGSDNPAAAHAVAFSVLDYKGRETGKGPVTFAKASTKIRSLANHLLTTKRGLQPNDHVVLMYPLGVEYIYALHACMYAGIVPIPLPVIDTGRLGEDVAILLDVVDKFACKAILCFGAVDEALKSKAVTSQVKAVRSAAAGGDAPGAGKQPGKTASGNLNAGLPAIVNTANGKVVKLGKAMALDDPQFYHARMRSLNDEGEAINDEVIDPAHDQSSAPALILCHLSADMQPVYTTHTHASLLSQLRIHTIHGSLVSSTLPEPPMTMTPPSPLLACLTPHSAPHIFYAALLGPYIGAQTYMLPAAEYYTQPNMWFELLYRLKVREVASSPSMMRHVMGSMKDVEYRSFSLHHLKNLVLPIMGRADVDLYRQIHQNFGGNRLEDAALGTCFSPPCNSCVSSRAYMRSEVLTLGVDRAALRVGRIRVLSAHRGENGRRREKTPKELHLQDCGRIVNNTVTVIVDENGALCKPNTVGDIYVCSPATVADARLVPVGGLDPALLFAPTGAKGFLHPIPAPTDAIGSVLNGSTTQASEQDSLEDPWDTLVLAGKPYEIVIFVVGQKDDELQVRVCDAVGACADGVGLLRSHWKEDVERTVEECWGGIGACVVHQTAPASVIIFLESPLDATSTTGPSGSTLPPAGPGPGGAPPVANNLALVFVVVNAVLEAHGFFPATIVVTKIGGLAPGRSGQKMRGRVAAAWASRKLPVLMEFAVRDSAVGGGNSRPPSEKSRSGSGASTPREDLGFISGVGSLSVMN
ncbi:hypothetical protein HDU87_006477 [Geranomyces variabilis]|uniref:DMAP1-binding domain-containing protein n=1 Tax=Geranomyces variabilis TaxID=109894 RepID=A0AAD5TFR2_9FUNG|nr:hypothetical protein HDU87_006477 [Geranomyces variabilis]